MLKKSIPSSMLVHKNKWRLFVFLSLFLLPLPGEATSSLVEWTFPYNPDDAKTDGGTPENLNQELTLTGAGTPTYNNTGATTFSARATGWQNGALTKYWQIQVDTRGYQDITLSSKQRSSTTGPRDFVIEYRIGDSGDWHLIPGGVLTLADNFTTGALDTLLLPAECSNQEKLFLRFLMTTNVSVNGGTVTSTGSSRIDDIVILGNLIGETDGDIPSSLCTGSSSTIHFNEIFPYTPTGTSEFVELLNNGIVCVDLSGWRIEDESHHKYIFPSGTIASPGVFLTFFKNFYMNNTSGDTLYLFDTENIPLESLHYDHPIKDLSYSFDGTDWQFTSFLTPGSENTFDELPDEETDQNQNFPTILLNEVLPNPLGDESQGEYIELFNPEDTSIQLANWILQDASNKRFVFTDEIIESKSYLTVYRSLFRFSLNNTGQETIQLLSPDNEVSASLTYTTPPEGQSYNSDGKKWRWSKILTPDKENQFSKEPRIIVKSKKDGFVRTPLIFEAHLKKQTRHRPSYHWDFGDGHGSNLEKPKHSYQKKGDYLVTVRIKDKGVDVEKSFSVTIRKYPKLSMTITAILPNPKGKDASSEWIEVENQSTKAIDLKNWKVATGEDPDSLINHPIAKSTLILPHTAFKLSHAHASFSLNNSQSVIELRSPDEQTVARVTYQEEEVGEDAVCHTKKDICEFSKSTESLATQESTASQDGPLPVLLGSEESSSSLPSPQGQPFVPDSKKVLLRRIQTDLNTLIHLYLADWYQQN